MKQWLWKQIVASGYDTSAAIDRASNAFKELDADEQRIVIRHGFGRLIATEAKRRRLLIPENGGPAEQMPLFAAVKTDGRWLRISYLTADLHQLRALHNREFKRAGRTTARADRLAYDLGLYEQHPDAPNLEAVWQTEHVEYRLEEAA